MKLVSSVFEEGGIIPSLYTCEGKNINPPLEILDVPQNAKSLVLIMEDPDVPKSLRPSGMYDHWVVINMPPDTKMIGENCKPPGIQGIATGGKIGYMGPCPPDREHRYFFRLFALDTLLKLSEGCTKAEVENAMQEHILKECQLMGLFEKGKGY